MARRRYPALLIALAISCVAWTGLVAAAELPRPTALEAALGAPQTIEVFEPHLTRGSEAVRLRYVGWPVERVLDHLLGQDWAQRNAELEFRALDGYLARVPVERFRRYQAFLVHARADGAPFTVDVPAQNERNVPLGPHYLIWDNTRDDGLKAEGATHWPYQVAAINSVADILAALLPGDLASRFADEAATLSKHCLTCHKLNGQGGEKHSIDLAERVREMPEQDFERWVLDPNGVLRGTTMPAFQANERQSDRVERVRGLYRYLRAMPVAAPR